MKTWNIAMNQSRTNLKPNFRRPEARFFLRPGCDRAISAIIRRCRFSRKGDLAIPLKGKCIGLVTPLVFALFLFLAEQCKKIVTPAYRRKSWDCGKCIFHNDTERCSMSRFIATQAILFGLLFFISGCAITPISFRRHEIYEFQTYKGKLTVHVAGQTRVNDEMIKAGATDKVYGFYDRHCPDEREAEQKAISEGRLYFSQPCEYEIWTTAYPSTIMHELRHFFEGKFHE